MEKTNNAIGGGLSANAVGGSLSAAPAAPGTKQWRASLYLRISKEDGYVKHILNFFRFFSAYTTINE